MKIKSIPFNTDVVRAILDGRKTVTRRVLKPQPIHDNGFWKIGGAGWSDKIKAVHPVPCHSLWNRMPCEPGDILYAQETWSRKQATQCLGITDECPHKSCETANGPCFGYEYIFQAEPTDHLPTGEKWRPSIHMPREAARIFLRVTGVRVERLQDITNEDAEKEGCRGVYHGRKGFPGSGFVLTPVDEFSEEWHGTIKPSDRPIYGWAANPWVWVIEFERCEKPEGWP